MDDGTQDSALWAKAMALADGDEEKARYRYIALRVEEISKADNDFNLKYIPIAQFAKVTSRSEEGCIELIRNGTYTGINKDGKWFVNRDTLGDGARTLTQERHDNDTTLEKRVLLFLAWATSLWPSRSDKSWCVFIRPGHWPHLVRPIGTKNWAAFFFFPIWHMVTLTRHGMWLLPTRTAFVVLTVVAPVIIHEVLVSSVYDRERNIYVDHPYLPYLWLFVVPSIIVFVLIDIALAYQSLIKGNKFRHKSLEAKGYKQVDILTGRTRFDVLAQLALTPRTVGLFTHQVLAQLAPKPRTFGLFIHPVYDPKVVPNVTAKNWVAFFFCPIWHLCTRTRHGLWLLLARAALALLGAVVIGAIIADGGYDASAIAVVVYILFQLVDLAASFIWLFKANTFRHKSLEARGYKLEDIIEARTKDEVLAKLKSAS